MSFKNGGGRSAGDLIFPVVISTPFAVGDVYSYLIKDEKIVLVDCGQKSHAALDQLTEGLKEQGIGPGNIDEIWLTHGHPDHFGQAAQLARQSGATVKGHRAERANFAGNNDRSLFRAFFEKHDIAAKQVNEMLGQLDWLQQYQEPIEPEFINEGDRLSSGRLSFNIKHTPGHAPGHVVFYSDDGLIFGGDVLLEHISTNALINFDADTGERNKSLLQYRQSLQFMKTLNGRVLPGHGKQIERIGAVADSHLNEQYKRYQKIIILLQQKSHSLYELSETLFPDALQRGEHFLVFSEIIGYLDWGLEEGTIRKEQRKGKVRFTAEPNS